MRGVLDEVRDVAEDAEPAMAVRTYGPGCLAVAVAGDLDGQIIARLGDLLLDRHICCLSAAELVVDLSGVRAGDPGLVRLLHRVRSLRGVEGCRVELCFPNETLEAELDDATLPEAFTVYAATRDDPLRNR